MKFFKEWIKNTYPEYFLEQINPSLQQISANDLAFLQRGGLNFNANDILRKIVNITPYNLMSITRHDPQKYQADVAKLEPSAGKENEEMIMQKQYLNKPHVLIVVKDDAIARLTNDPDVEGFVANMPNNERIIVIPASGYDKLPDNTNIYGVMNQKGKNSLAHEAGHLAQKKPSEFLSTSESDPNASAEKAQEEYQKYLGLPYEVGTRLGFLKNINSKSTLKSMAVRGIDRNMVPMVNLMIDALPDDEIQRFELLLSIPELGKVMVQNNPEIMNKFKSREEFAGFIQNVYMKVLHNLFKTDDNIKQLMDHVFYIRNKQPQKYKQLIQSLRYAYPRVAVGQQYGDKSRQGEMA